MMDIWIYGYMNMMDMAHEGSTYIGKGVDRIMA